MTTNKRHTTAMVFTGVIVIALFGVAGCGGGGGGGDNYEPPSYDYEDLFPTPSPSPDPPIEQTWPQEAIGSWETDRNTVIILGADGSWEERAVGASSGWRGHIHHRDGDSFYIIQDGASVIDSRVTINIISGNTINIELHYDNGSVVGLICNRVGAAPPPPSPSPEPPAPAPEPPAPSPSNWRYLQDLTPYGHGNWRDYSVAFNGSQYAHSFRGSYNDSHGRWVFADDFGAVGQPTRIAMIVGVTDDSDPETSFTLHVKLDGNTVFYEDVSLGHPKQLDINVSGYRQMDIDAKKGSGDYMSGRPVLVQPKVYF